MKRYFLTENDIVNLLGMIVEDVILYGADKRPLKRIPEQPIPGSETPPPTPQQSYRQPPMPQQPYGQPSTPQQSYGQPSTPQQPNPASQPVTGDNGSEIKYKRGQGWGQWWKDKKNAAKNINDKRYSEKMEKGKSTRLLAWFERNWKYIIIILAVLALIVICNMCSGDNMETEASADNAGNQTNVDTTKYNRNSIGRVIGEK